ncbi:hypothetical protein C8C78_103128 [Halanaerobium congolense]|jgi:hypothetical protein|uniref:Uncharacterized protein n=1 Tax=Halanaerobium congolense TaxID=54121 RepID=A0A318ECT2_9FIRM|nr:hypothetical protein C8C78_103128 [Halanaerobium congolense]
MDTNAVKVIYREKESSYESKQKNPQFLFQEEGTRFTTY